MRGNSLSFTPRKKKEKRRSTFKEKKKRDAQRSGEYHAQKNHMKKVENPLCFRIKRDNDNV